MNKNLPPEELALDLARRSPHPLFKIAAVLVDKRNRVVSWGWNHWGVHAEQHAFQRANRDRVAGCRIVLAGISKSRRVITSRPCDETKANCWRLCLKNRVSKITYSTPDGFVTVDLGKLKK